MELLLPLPPDIDTEELGQLHRDEVAEYFLEHADTRYKDIAGKLGEQGMRALERHVMLRTIDTHWMDHLTAMENSRQSMGLEAYGQRDPLVAYKRRSHLMFEDLSTRIRVGIVRTLFRVDVRERVRAQATAAPVTASNGQGQANGATATGGGGR